jgi:hypothetical protein
MSRRKTNAAFFLFYTFLLLLPASQALAQALQSGTPIQFSLPAQNYTSNYYIDVPAGAQQLTVTVSGSGGADVDLFVRFASPFPIAGDPNYPSSPQQVGEDTLNRWSHFHSFSDSSTETINVLPSSHVPLAAGRWYISVINDDLNNTDSTATTLTATVYNSPQVAAINVDFNNPGTSSTDVCDVAPWTDSTPATPVGGNPGTTLGQQRQNALKYAVQQITTALQPPVAVTIRACWDHLGGSANKATIAHATPVTFLVDEPDFGGYVLPLRYTWYAITEAVRQAGTSQCGLIGGACGAANNEEIEATFNEDIGSSSIIGGRSFYYGYTATNDTNPIDFVSVAMHELTHGMGFIGLANTDSTQGPIGAKAGIAGTGSSSSIAYQNLDQGPYDDVYDVNASIVNAETNAWTPFMGYEVNGAGDAARAAALISNNLLRWSEATAVNSSVNQLRNQPAPGSFPLLYAPNPISNGSTLSHTVQADDLMNAMYPFPPPRTMGLAAPMLAPLGWGTAARTPPTYTQPYPSNWFDRTHGGHGIDFQLARHDPVYGDVYILVFYTYDDSGVPEWYLATGNIVDGVFVGSLDNNGNTLLYSTYGSNLGLGQLNPTPQANVYGTVTVDFNQASSSPVCRNADRSAATILGVMSWAIGPSQQSATSADWCIEPLVTLPERATPDYTGHWFAPADGGWGMEFLNFNGNSSSSSLFVLVYYPSSAGLPTWAVASGTLNNGTANLQLLARSNGYCRTCTPPATSETTQIGTMTLNLTPPATQGAAANGTATFTINYPGGGTFSRSNDPITMLSLPPGQ